MLIDQLQDIVGAHHVLVSAGAKQAYLKGYRHGCGDALAVVRPGSLLELWKVARVCVRSNVILIMQAANTGLTGGSTPCGDYDRYVVVVNTMRLTKIHLLGDAEQAVCLPGATLHKLEKLLSPHGREPHSEIGSSCLGASVVGGVCNNSGGALVRRGPAYTQAALYARVVDRGEIELVNELGIDIGDDPEAMLQRLEQGDFSKELSCAKKVACSAHDYLQRVCAVDEPTPARFNADPNYLHGASGSAGRLIVFALRLDTFPKSLDARMLHIASDCADALTELRRHMLLSPACIPISGEYLSRETFELTARYGRDTFLAVRFLGTERLPSLFRLKRWINHASERLNGRLRHSGEWLSQWISACLPGHLPRALRLLGKTYAHHLLLKLDAGQLDTVLAQLSTAPFASKLHMAECSPQQGRDLLLHRFAAAGAAMRYALLGQDGLGELLALDVALPRNAENWCDLVSDDLRRHIAGEFLYGHFFCHVFHLDLVLRKGVDPVAFKREILAEFDDQGAECPAEHNVGHLYEARPVLREFYKQLDPSNTLNPGIGLTSRKAGWR